MSNRHEEIMALAGESEVMFGNYAAPETASREDFDKWQAARAALSAAVAELIRDAERASVLKDALWQACGDSEELVNAYLRGDE